jgi:hypothetical protein
MEVNGQLQASATLPPEKQPVVPTWQEAEWASVPVWKQRRKEKSLALVENRTQISLPSAHCNTDWVIQAPAWKQVPLSYTNMERSIQVAVNTRVFQIRTKNYPLEFSKIEPNESVYI